jgi:hypothetical protein
MPTIAMSGVAEPRPPANPDQDPPRRRGELIDDERDKKPDEPDDIPDTPPAEPQPQPMKEPPPPPEKRGPYIAG